MGIGEAEGITLATAIEAIDLDTTNRRHAGSQRGSWIEWQGGCLVDHTVAAAAPTWLTLIVASRTLTMARQ